jgi:pimeloyl-ACP methyl ester carboxylesterase
MVGWRADKDGSGELGGERTAKMSAEQPEMLLVDDAYGRRRLAVLQMAGHGEGARLPGLLWLPGFNSVMTSSKATSLAMWVASTGRALTRFDYSGHGQSEGRFEAGCIGQWLADCSAVLDWRTGGRQIVVGSSMGGYLALLLAQQRPQRLAALVLIAPAWNMTERLMWGEMGAPERAALARDGVWHRPSAYGDPYPITRRLIEEGRHHQIDIEHLPLSCPLRILHGCKDADVPFAGSEALVRHQTGDARLLPVPDGDHRLAREEDLALLKALIEEVDGVQR